MIVAFCGHSTYTQHADDDEKILDILENKAHDECVEFYLGEYGFFDNFAYECAKKFQRAHPQSKLIFVTPYPLNEKNSQDKKDRFDLIVYPALESVPPRYAIVYRNRWMVEQADLIIAYITHAYGGAYTMYRHALRKKKEIYNIAPSNI